MWLLVLQRMFFEFVLDVIYFPLWWYSGGALRAAKFCCALFQDGNIRLAPWLWLKNLFVPMYGQTDIEGRMMSIFMRFVNVIGRGFALLVWFLIVLVIFLLWLVFPLFVVYMLFMSLSAGK